MRDSEKSRCEKIVDLQSLHMRTSTLSWPFVVGFSAAAPVGVAVSWGARDGEEEELTGRQHSGRPRWSSSC